MRTLHKADFTALATSSDFRAAMQWKSATFSEDSQVWDLIIPGQQ